MERLWTLLAAGAVAGCTQTKFTLDADKTANGRNAMHVRVYQLRSAEAFGSADFESLWNEPKKTLGNDLVESRTASNYTILPPGTLEVNFPESELDADTKFVGFAVLFHVPADRKDVDRAHQAAKWKKTLPRKETKAYTITDFEVRPK